MENTGSASRIAAAIKKGIGDGFAPVAIVRAALKDASVPKWPRLIASFTTVAALVVGVWKFASGAITLPELVQLIQQVLNIP